MGAHIRFMTACKLNCIEYEYATILVSAILELKYEGDQHNKKRVAIENEDLWSEFPHHLPWIRLHQDVTAVHFETCIVSHQRCQRWERRHSDVLVPQRMGADGHCPKVNCFRNLKDARKVDIVTSIIQKEIVAP